MKHQLTQREDISLPIISDRNAQSTPISWSTAPVQIKRGAKIIVWGSRTRERQAGSQSPLPNTYVPVWPVIVKHTKNTPQMCKEWSWVSRTSQNRKIWEWGSQKVPPAEDITSISRAANRKSNGSQPHSQEHIIQAASTSYRISITSISFIAGCQVMFIFMSRNKTSSHSILRQVFLSLLLKKQHLTYHKGNLLERWDSSFHQ